MDNERAGADESERARENDALMARLNEMFGEEDPPPAVMVELAKQSFGLRTVDAELAALIADSAVDGAAVAVRAGGSGTSPRLLTFETAELAVEIEVSGSGRHRRLLGQLLPPEPARIEVRQPSTPDPRWAEVDDRGRFALDKVDPGPISLTCHRPGRRAIATPWTGVT